MSKNDLVAMSADVFWNLAADGYRSRMESDFSATYDKDRIFINTIRSYATPPKVLDLGCGYGHTVAVIKERDVVVGGYTGIDCSSRMIELAQSNFPTYNFKKGWLEKLEESISERFDLFLMFEALIHIGPDSIIKIMTNLHNFLNPGAQGLLLIDIGEGVIAATHEHNVFIPEGSALYIYPWVEDELISKLADAGFTVTSTYAPCACHMLLVVKLIE